MVNNSGQLYTIEGIAAGILMLTTAYLVLSATSVYTPAETHISDMQLEQLGTDALNVMDTPYSSAGAGGGTSEIASYIENNKKADFAIRFNELATTKGAENIKFNSTVYYRNATTGIIHSYAFTDMAIIGTNWTEVKADEPKGWSPRDTHSSVAMPDGSIVLMGGYDGNFMNDVWMSPQASKGATWTRMTSAAGWSARSGHSSVMVPGSPNTIILMGGQGNGIYKNDSWMSSDSGANWIPMTGAAGWTARSGQSCVRNPLDGSIVLMGGYDGNFKNDTWRSVDNGATWVQRNASAKWSARSGQSCVAMPDGSIILLGGYEGGINYKNDVWRSNDNGGNWTLIKPNDPNNGWMARASHSCLVMSDNSIVLMGGENNNAGFMNDVWWSTDGANWNPMTGGAGWSARASQSSVVVPGSPDDIILMGGENSGVYKNDVWRSTDNGKTWTEMKPNDIIDWSARSGHSSVAMPNGSIVLMGGKDSTGYKSDVWRSTDNGGNWSLMTAGAGWSARSGHCSVVVQGPPDRIILMGGENSGGYLNDVWMSEDYGATWTQRTANAWPSPRSGHSSVVMHDGSIVVMGGQDSTGYLSEVWRSTNNGATWNGQILPTGSIWGNRAFHTSVVMPDGSIVLMGGTNGGAYFNDTWRGTLANIPLPPFASATWTQAAASTSIWTERASHSSVVMPDSSIVLMGGTNGGVYFNDTWRSTDYGTNWKNITTSASGWSVRASHSSVALPVPPGNIVLVVLMGGQDSTGYKNDVWRSTSKPLISNRERMMTVSRLVQIKPPLAIPGMDNRDQTVLMEVALWRD